jgi:hypothetical protein
VDALTMGELVAVLALGQDNAFGQPLETQARSTLLAIWLAETAGLPAQDRDTTYWAAQLHYLGCTAHAHEVAVLFGDDIQAHGPAGGCPYARTATPQVRTLSAAAVPVRLRL